MYVADTPEKVNVVRMITLYHALKLEVNTGLKRSSKGRATGTIIREATGLKQRKKAALLIAFDQWLKQNGMRECEHKFRELGSCQLDDGRYADAAHCTECDGWYPGTVRYDDSGYPVGFTVLTA